MLRAAAALLLAAGAGAQPTALQQAIDAAIAAGQPSLVLPPGTRYAQGNATLTVRGARGFTLDGNGATLVFAPGHGVLLREAYQSTVRNLTVVYDPPCFTQGTIVALNQSARTVDVRLDAGWPVPDAAVNPWFNSVEIKFQFFDPSTRARISGQPGSCIVSVVGQVSPGVWRVYELPQFGAGYWPPVGTLATISPRIAAWRYQIPDYYSGQAWSVYNSSRVTSEDVTLLGSGNFAVMEWGNEGGHVFRRFTLDRDPSNGALLSSNTDGFHSFSTGTGATIVDSSFSWHGDDSINYHNRVQLVLDPPTSPTFATANIIDVGDVPSIEGGDAEPARSWLDLAPGDTLRLFSGSSAQEKGAFTVTGVTRVTDAGVLARALAITNSWPGVSINPAAVGVWAVGLAGANATGLAQRDVVQFDRRSSAGGVVDSSAFHEAYDSCWRMQAIGATLVNSTFSAQASGITVVYDPAWLEGSAGLSNIAILNNTFVAIGDPPATSIDQVVHADTNVANMTVAGNTVRAK